MKNIKIHHMIYIGFLIFLSYSLMGSVRLFMKARNNLAEAQSVLDRQSDANEALHHKLVEVGKQIYIERVARDTLGLARENEVVFVLPSEDEVKKLSTRLLPLSQKDKAMQQKPHWEEWLSLFE